MLISTVTGEDRLKNIHQVVTGFPLLQTDKIPWYFYDISRFFLANFQVFFHYFNTQSTQFSQDLFQVDVENNEQQKKKKIPPFT